MNTNELVYLMTVNANWTSHVRIYSGKWHTDASRIPLAVSSEVGKIIALIQDNIKLLCDPKKEFLQIYNFQVADIAIDPFADEDNNQLDSKEAAFPYCTIDITIRPDGEIDDTDLNTGRKFSLAVDLKTGEVSNDSHVLVKANLATETELKDPCVVYGNYKDYRAPCSFLAMANLLPISSYKALLDGKYANSKLLTGSKVFDSPAEACTYLDSIQGFGRYVTTLPYSKEQVLTLKDKNLLIPQFIDIKQYKQNALIEVDFLTAFADLAIEIRFTDNENISFAAH